MIAIRHMMEGGVAGREPRLARGWIGSLAGLAVTVLASAGHASAQSASGSSAGGFMPARGKIEREFEAMAMQALLAPVIGTGQPGGRFASRAMQYWQGFLAEQIARQAAARRQINLSGGRQEPARSAALANRLGGSGFAKTRGDRVAASHAGWEASVTPVNDAHQEQ